MNCIHTCKKAADYVTRKYVLKKIVTVNKYNGKFRRRKALWIEFVRKDLTGNERMVRKNLVEQKRGMAMETIK